MSVAKRLMRSLSLFLLIFIFNANLGAVERQTICGMVFPSGWFPESYTRLASCGSTVNTNATNLVRYDNLPVGATLAICYTSGLLPEGWGILGRRANTSSCGGNGFLDTADIKHLSCGSYQSNSSCYPDPPVDPNPIPTISASSSSIVVPYGASSKNTTISWSASSTASSWRTDISYKKNGGGEVKWKDDVPAGSDVFPIAPGDSVVFYAYQHHYDLSRSNSVTVKGVAGAQTTFAVTPAFNIVSTGAGSAKVLIPATATMGPFGFKWNAPGYDAIDIQGQVNNGTWGAPLWIAPSGTNGDNISVGTTYNYRMYPHGLTSPLLATLSVSGVAAPAPTFSINPAHVIVPLNATTGTFTFAWNAPGYEALDVTGQVVTGGIPGTWSGPLSIAASGNNGDNIAVGTTYNYRFYPRGDSVHIIGTLSVTASR